MRAYYWPGNVRELENIMERILVFLKGNRLTVAEIPDQILSNKVSNKSEKTSDQITPLAESERNLILQALDQSGGNRSFAARLLKIPRHVLLYRLKKYGLDK